MREVRTVVQVFPSSVDFLRRRHGVHVVAFAIETTTELDDFVFHDIFHRGWFPPHKKEKEKEKQRKQRNKELVSLETPHDTTTTGEKTHNKAPVDSRSRSRSRAQKRACLWL